MDKKNLPKVTIQIYRKGRQMDDGFDVIPHGTGILFQHQKMYFLISAAHNFDNEDIEGLGFLTKNKELVIFQGDLSRFSTEIPINEPADLAVFKLTKETIEDIINDGYEFLSLDDLILNKDYNPNGNYQIYGYPASKSKKNNKTKIIKRGNFYFISKKTKIPKIRNFDPVVNIPIDWHYKKLRTPNNKRVQSCKLNGISGCGLWYECDEGVKLVGIMISYNKIHSFILGSIIDLATEIIRKKFIPSFPQTKLIKFK